MLLTRMPPPRGLHAIVRLIHVASSNAAPCLVPTTNQCLILQAAATPATPMPRLQHLCPRYACNNPCCCCHPAHRHRTGARKGVVPKGMTVPAQMNKPMQLRQSPTCTNLLFNPYRLHKRLPLSSYFTLAGWKERWRRIKLFFTSQMAVALCTRHLKGWTRAGFKEEVATMFTDINTYLAQRNMHGITPVRFAST